MTKIHAKITGVGGYVPKYVLTNEELSRMVDTTDEWIMSRIGIKERHLLKDEGRGASYLATKAIEDLFQKTGVKAEEIDLVVCATITPDHAFPSTAALIVDNLGMKNAWGFDLSAACSGFLFGLETAANFVTSGKYKKVILVGADVMSAIVDYTDRSTCPIFGDGGGAVLLEASTEDGIGLLDTELHIDGIGKEHLHLMAGGSFRPATHETVDNKEHYIFQEGRTVFKHAVSKMSDVSLAMMKRNNISKEDLTWFVPHQANMRIIESTAHHMGITKEQVMINISKYGNTTAATLPLCLWDWESQLKKGDKIIFSTFGAGFTWGAAYLTWAYDGK